MTIRRNVNIADINKDYSAFMVALDELPSGMFLFSRSVQKMVSDTLDDLELYATIAEVPLDRCDRIREVEALMFDMIRQTNTGSDIEQVIQIGNLLDTLEGEERRRVLTGCTDAYERFLLRRVEEEAEADNETRNGVALVVADGFDDFRQPGGEFDQ